MEKCGGSILTGRKLRREVVASAPFEEISLTLSEHDFLKYNIGNYTSFMKGIDLVKLGIFPNKQEYDAFFAEVDEEWSKWVQQPGRLLFTVWFQGVFKTS